MTSITGITLITHNLVSNTQYRHICDILSILITMFCKSTQNGCSRLGFIIPSIHNVSPTTHICRYNATDLGLPKVQLLTIRLVLQSPKYNSQFMLTCTFILLLQHSTQHGEHETLQLTLPTGTPNSHTPCALQSLQLAPHSKALISIATSSLTTAQVIKQITTHAKHLSLPNSTIHIHVMEHPAQPSLSQQNNSKQLGITATSLKMLIHTCKIQSI